MIYALSGTVLRTEQRLLVITVNGVGYGVAVPATVAEQYQASDPAELHIYTHVREEALELYGFTRSDELSLFKKLIGISGVGPKSALAVFEIADFQTIQQAIAAGDAAFLQKVSGIGKKTAELIVLKLRDSATELSEGETSAHSDVLDALTGLGYPLADVRQIIRQLPADTSTEEKVTQALRLLGSNK